ncbi:hypothetical protein PRZ48_002435 [Zasmidium cellare]|uniref:RING-type domain-containing protein n=1 Tax=Zasmidium cellare TaxID=395010 RepID=A0ABR0F419_ZASCE|nr:hypothetical protein PRZ48_002435 [Zasmidium cellare]
MATAPTFLDDLDDETAQLILNMQLEDIANDEAAEASWRRPSRKQRDHQFARQLYEEELALYRLQRDLPEPPPAPEPELFECCACGESNSSEKDYTAQCGHHYCTDCLTGLFAAAMKDERLYPPRCCTRAIPFPIARRYLTREIEAAFADKKEELDDADRHYCCVPTCSAYIPRDHRFVFDTARCPFCQEYTCTKCNSAAHTGHCPVDKGLEEVIEAGREEGWQRCQRCKRMIELTIGCNHITCVCRAEFCYVCGAKWKSCRCPQFDEARLLERAQEVAGREGANVAQVAEELRGRHECEPGEHQYRFTPGAFTCDGCNLAMTQFIYRCTACHGQKCSRCRRHF